ncbi:hypothetical protein BGX21_005784, partial [Mortierella sp. AD011]
MQFIQDGRPDDYLNDVQELLKNRGITFEKLLTDLLSMRDTDPLSHTTRFYRSDGPGNIVAILSEGVKETAKSFFYDACVEVVTGKAMKELGRLTKLKELRSPAKSITEQDIKNFRLGSIGEAIAENAPVLNNILHRLTSKVNSDRDPKTIISVVGSILIFLQSRTSNKLQAMMGLFLFSTGSQRKVVELMSAAGLSVSYSTIMTALDALTSDALARIKNAIVDG